MTDTLIDLPKELSSLADQKIVSKAQVSPSTSSQREKPKSIMLFVFMVLLEAMDQRQKTAYIQSKGLSANASVQNSLNEEDKKIRFSQVPDGDVGQATLVKVQSANEQYTKERADIQDRLLSLRQQAQVDMTKTNETVSNLEQDASENTGWMRTLQKIFSSINQMSGFGG